jgi:hypothetical protein
MLLSRENHLCHEKEEHANDIFSAKLGSEREEEHAWDQKTST